MSRTRRRIISNSCYEICFRARSTLPLVAKKTIKFLIGAILARAQRDDKVILCHDIWNGSHCHMILVAKDCEQLVKFYTEVQKKLTDAIKRLVGEPHLRIWEGRPMVALIADLEKAKDRIGYLYANPAQDNLVNSIEEFPGYSSYTEFRANQNSLSGTSKELFPWVRLTSIPETGPDLTDSQDIGTIKILKKENGNRQHVLKRQPNAWMTCFGVTSDTQVKEENESLLETIRFKEEEARGMRVYEKKPLMGVHKLVTQPILTPHTPKKRDRKIFVLASQEEVRVEIILGHQEFCDCCAECYLRWRCGDFTVEWPPGAFKPPVPPNYNLLAA